MEKAKIILLATDCSTTRIVYNFLKSKVDIERVILEEEISKMFLLKRRVRNLGILKVAGQLMFMMMIGPLLKKKAGARIKALEETYLLDSGSIPESVITRVTSVNTDECRSLLTAAAPDLILVNGTRIIGKKTLASGTAPFVNIHTGITPMFRGVHGGYWAIASRRPELFGTTIHQVDAGIDTGKVIKQITGRPEGADNFATYPLLQYALCLPALAEVIGNFMKERCLPVSEPLVKESMLCYHPTIWEYLAKPKTITTV